VSSKRDPLIIKAWYGDRRILSVETIHFDAQDAHELAKVICQLIIGTPELRDGEKPTPHDFSKDVAPKGS